MVRSISLARVGFALFVVSVLGLPGVAAAQAAPNFLFDLQVAGDLNGDGGRDLIGWYADQEGATYGALPTLTMYALRGTDGAILWTGTAPAHYAVMEPGRVGPFGTPGVFVQLIRVYPDNNSDIEIREQWLCAYRGDGTLVWERHRDLPSAVVEGGWWGFSETADLMPGPASDLLLVSSESGGLDENAGADAPDTVGAARGTDGTDGPALPHNGFNMIVPDVTGDDLDELGFVSATFTDATVEIRRPTDGSLVWRSTFPIEGSGGLLLPVGDATGDDVSDLLYPSMPAVLLSGADGSVVWTRDIGWPHALGDVDGDHLADVGGSYKFNQQSFRHVAVNGDGDFLYLREYAVDMDGADFAFGYSYDVGDADGDGVRDRYQSLYSQGSGVVLDTASGLVSGASGEILWGLADGTAQPFALRATIDGEGDDFLRADCPGDQGTYRATDGADGSIIWSASAPGCPGFEEAADLDGDGHADLVLQSPLTVLSGADGSALWS